MTPGDTASPAGLTAIAGWLRGDGDLDRILAGAPAPVTQVGWGAGPGDAG